MPARNLLVSMLLMATSAVTQAWPVTTLYTGSGCVELIKGIDYAKDAFDSTYYGAQPSCAADGYYSTKEGDKWFCCRCPHGTFSRDRKSCASCAPGKTTAKAARTSAADCKTWTYLAPGDFISLRTTGWKYVGIPSSTSTGNLKVTSDTPRALHRFEVVQSGYPWQALPWLNSQVAFRNPSVSSGANMVTNTKYGNRIIMNGLASAAQPWEHQIVEPRQADGKVRIMTDDLATWQTVNGGGSDIKTASLPSGWWGDWEKFVINYLSMPRTGTQVALQAYSKHYVGVSSGVAKTSQSVTANVGAVGQWEKWRVKRTTYNGVPAVVFRTMSFAINADDSFTLQVDPKDHSRVGNYINYGLPERLWKVELYESSQWGMYMTLKNVAGDCYLQAVNGGGGALKCVKLTYPGTWEFWRLPPAF